MSKIDTARILVSWECNLSCSYCCNEQDRFRSGIIKTKLDNVNFNNYKFFCLSGGEPLLKPNRLADVIYRIPGNKTIILYTNGILLHKKLFDAYNFWRIDYINVGLHEESSFTHIINNVIKQTKDSFIGVRFHLNETFKYLNMEEEYPLVNFKYWKMDDCERDNEDRFILED